MRVDIMSLIFRNAAFLIINYNFCRRAVLNTIGRSAINIILQIGGFVN